LVQGSFKDNAAVAVAATATALLADNANRVEAEIFNNGTQTVFVGDGNVTVANGRPLRPGRSLVVRGIGSVYGIVAASTCDCRITEVS
jgi:hypothetical protein